MNLPPRNIHRGLLVGLACALSGCGMTLMPTPNLYRPTSDSTHPAPVMRRGPNIDILYATDRQQDGSDMAGPTYNTERSHAMAYGRVTVQLGTDPGKRIAKNSTDPNETVLLQIAKRQEIGRFPHHHHAAHLDPKHQKAKKHFAQLLRQKIQATDQKDVYIYVHGFNNQFDKAAMVLGQLWHFMGRVGVPVLYSWPAGRHGVFGYEADHDSADFTVAHLKQFLTAIGEVEQVERVHILAFSTGAPATLRALHELLIKHRAKNNNARRLLKLENLVLIAADFDSDVFHERILAEGVHRVPKRFTLYTATGDWAIGFSEFLHGGLQRLGGINPRKHDDLTAINLLTNPELHMIMVKPLGFLSHSYFVNHPAVSSDLILLLRHNKDPGAQHGRPLRLDTTGAWWLDHEYPKKK